MEEKNRMEFTYLYQPPNKWTFKQSKLKAWVEYWCKGKVLNLFAGKVKLNVDEFRVDISDEFKPEFVGDAYFFVSNTVQKFNTIVLDPPYSIRKAKEKYNGRYIGNYKRIKDKLSRILISNGRIISLTNDSVGMSKSRGFKKIAICLVCHSGEHNDTIGVVEEKIFTNINQEWDQNLNF